MTDCQTFQTEAKNDTYFMDLPNVMDYTVSVEWEDSTGNLHWTDVGIADVQAGPGITAQTLDFYMISKITAKQNWNQVFF